MRGSHVVAACSIAAAALLIVPLSCAGEHGCRLAWNRSPSGEGDGQAAPPTHDAEDAVTVLPSEWVCAAPGAAFRILDRAHAPNPRRERLAREYSLPGGVRFSGPMLPPFGFEVRGAFDTPFSAAMRAAPATRGAPTGAAALRLARSWGLPDQWNARHHPTHFILGPPKSGTTFLSQCYASGAVSGHPRVKPYPPAWKRWPVGRHDNGEPEEGLTITQYNGVQSWNRTGFRRFSIGKEPHVYMRVPRWDRMEYYRVFEGYPPVEPESKDWTVMDGSPVYLMLPRVAERVFEDHCSNLEKLRFVVGWRGGLARAFSHFAMFAAWGSVNASHFIDRLRFERSIWDRDAACTVLIDNPDAILDMPRLRLRFVLQHCFVETEAPPGDQSFFGQSLPVVGLRYWLHFFPAKHFTVIRTAALETRDPHHTANILAAAFNLTATRGPCPGGAGWGPSSTCAGEHEWDDIYDSCTDAKGTGARRPASFSWYSSKLGIVRGSREERKPFRELFARYDDLMLKLVRRFGVRLVEK
ncbi:hypothetical protein DIPPA_00527 [Diplonema papillatum]|nr:hypothetical protein DIPPA_00527 [Diplonema papillatum]